MQCNCEHEAVCQYASEIRSHLSRIIEYIEGYGNSQWDEVSELVQKICCHRLPKKSMIGRVTKNTRILRK